MPQNEYSEELGDALVKQDLITREQLAEAREHERASGVPWYRQLLQKKLIDMGVLGDVLSYEFHSRSARQAHRNLGETLVDMNAITEKQLNDALNEQKRSGRLLGNILQDRGIVTSETLTKALARQYGLDFAPADKTPSEKAALDSIAEAVARKYRIIPIKLEGDKLNVLIDSPQSRDRLEEARILTGLRINPIMTAVDDITEEIKARYSQAKPGKKRRKATAAPVTEDAAQPKLQPKAKTQTAPPRPQAAPKTEGEEEEMSEERPTSLNVEPETKRFEEIAQQAEGASVVKLVSTIVEGAVNSGATDVHLDPQEPEMRVRYRIDGVLHDVMSIPAEIENAVVSRVKILADLDITETRHPQDGHISLDIGDREFDIRVATLPTFLGERVVLRMLDQTTVLAGIKDLGLEEDDQKKLMRLIEQPYGMILVTGPTGSGKTTTLYAALNQKNVIEESIVTIEDPVEYQVAGINQVQIDPDIDVGFASTLRSALRQDIDVLLVGEIRDSETAHIGVRAAMTGHLVFSTLHTNDAPEAVSTLRNMGVPSYLIASSITGVLAQRLVRLICDNCKTSYKPSESLLKSTGLPASTRKLYKGKGCELCYHTGMRGRTGVFEVMEITPDVRNLIAEEAPLSEIAKAAKLKTMGERCKQKLKRGETTVEEYFRVVRA